MDTFWKALTVLTAFTALLITYRSHLVARERFRLDLFDKRFKVFEAARHLVSHAVTTGDVSQEQLWAFRAAVIEKEFLFGDQIVAYLNKMDKHAVRASTMGAAERQTLGPAADPGQAAAQQRNRDQRFESLTWLTEQLQQLHAQFAPEMRIRTRRLL